MSYISGLIIGVVMAFCLFMIVLYIFCYVFCHRCHGRRRRSTSHPEPLIATGLDLSGIKSLPTFVHRRSSSASNGCGGDGGGTGDVESGSAAPADDDDHDMAAEVGCAICLGVFEEDEMVRLLPNCKHVFHVGCIDFWLYSNTTCPLCRTDVRLWTGPKTATAEADAEAVEVSSPV